jgi:hypothetical protein
MSQINIVLKDLSELALLLNGEHPAQKELSLRKKVATTPNTQLFFNTSGLFVDCSLAAPVMNTLIQPIRSLANAIPVRRTDTLKTKYAYITQLGEGSETPQDEVCDPPPSVGDFATCTAEYDMGRLSYETKTMEIDKLIQRAKEGIRNDFFFIGDIRGVSAFPSQFDAASNRDLIVQSAVRRQMQLVLRKFQRRLTDWLWNGDPTDVAQNGAGGGWKSFWGLMFQVADDYDTKPYVSGTACTQLNSDVKDFTEEASRDGLVGEDNLYEYLQELEDTIYNKAALMGLLPTEWVWVFHPITWGQAVKALPCDMVQDGCNNDNAVVNVNDGGSGLFNLAMRRQMTTDMAIEVNGRTYPVMLDDSLPYTEDVGAKEYTSTIFFLPLVVAGEEALYWKAMDYNLIDEALSPIPGSQTDMQGWTDGGQYHWIIEHVRRCFLIDAKMEVTLEFLAPHLAGRIDNVTVRTIQRKPAARAAAA